MRQLLSRAAGILAAAVLLVCVWPSPASASQPYLIGGSEADQPYPFMVSLQQGSGEHFCGASLIRPQWLLTAAHCVEDRRAPGAFTARVGSTDRTRGGEVARSAEVVVHPDYRPGAAGGDLALVRLAAPVQARPVELAGAARVGTGTRLLGWGQTCPTRGCGEAPTTLRQLDTAIVDGSRCTAAFDPAVELCTDNPRQGGACYGDSGGPQLVRADGRWRLAGLSSRSGNDQGVCGSAPSIYTSAVAYAPWINDRVGASPAA